MTEEIKKNLPYLIGGGVAIAGLFLFLKGTGDRQEIGSTVVQSDNSSSVNAAAAAYSSRLQASAQAFGALLGYKQSVDLAEIDSRTQTEMSRYSYMAQADANRSLLQAKTIDAQTQALNINSARKAAAHSDNTKAIASIASVAALALFCYGDTEIAERKRVPYTHGGMI